MTYKIRSEEEILEMRERLGSIMKESIDSDNELFQKTFNQITILNWVLGNAPDDAVIEDLCHSALNISPS